MRSHNRATWNCGILALILINIILPQVNAVLVITTDTSFYPRYVTQDVTFDCTITESNSIFSVNTVRWYFSNNLIVTNGIASGAFIGRTSGGTVSQPSLFVSNLNSSDAGSYICSASSTSGENKNSSHITLGITPSAVPSDVKIYDGSSSLSINAGESIELNCSASGLPHPNITWYRNGVSLWPGSPYTVSNADATKAGQYTCTATNDRGSASSTVNLIVYVKPSSVSLSVSSTNVNAGTGVVFSCNVGISGIPSHSYRWLKDNALISGETNSVYSIASTTGADDGSYQCQAFNAAGSTPSSAERLTVNTAAAPSGVTFSQTSPYSVRKGDSVSVTCSASGTPNPTFVWTKGGSTVVNGPTLAIPNVDVSNGGEYRCTATNSVNSAFQTFTLNVQYAPEISSSQNSVSATDGETLTLTCSNNANPTATVFEWNCGGTIENRTQTFSIIISGTANFDCSCKAFNIIGASALQAFNVTVSAGGGGGTGTVGASTGGLTTGEIAAICLAVLFIVLIIIIIIVCCCLYGVCAGVCGKKKEKAKVEPEIEKEKEVIHHVEIPRFHEVSRYKPRVPSAVTRKDVNLTVNHENMFEEEEFEINTKYAIVPPGSHRSVNGTIISLQDQRTPRDHRLPALDLTYDEEERRRKKRRRKKKRHHHREPAEGMESPHEPRESSRSRRSHRSHRHSNRHSGELMMDDQRYHSRYEDGDLVVIPGPDGYDH